MGRIVRRFGRFHQVEILDALYQYRQILADVAGVQHGMRIRQAVTDGITVTGATYGIHLEAELLGTGEVTGTWEGMRIEMYAEIGTDVHTVYGIWMTNSIPTAVIAHNYYFMRFSENGGSDVNAAFCLSVGGTSDILNLFLLTGNPTAWDAAIAPAGARTGRIGVECGGVQLWIPLWTA